MALDVPLLVRHVRPRDLKMILYVRARALQVAEKLMFCIIVRTGMSVTYQGTTLVVPHTTHDEGFSPWGTPFYSHDGVPQSLP
jgi:hypothetical protein